MKKNMQLTVAGFLFMTSAAFMSCDKPIVAGNTGGGSGGGNPNPSALAKRVITDTPYGPDPKQQMDIYLPAGRNSNTKVIVMIHGGAWVAGDKRDLDGIILTFQQKWPEAAIVNINYRLANTTNIHHAEIMADIKSAVAFVTGNKNSLAVSDTLAMFGASAGGQLALLYTYTQNTNNYVKCVGDLFGPAVLNDWQWYNSYNIFLGVFIKDVLKQYNGSTWEADATDYIANSPYSRVQANSKPTIVFHGQWDPVVPVYQSQWFSAKLAQLGVPYVYTEYPFEFHSLNAGNTVDCVSKTVNFFQRYMH